MSDVVALFLKTLLVIVTSKTVSRTSTTVIKSLGNVIKSLANNFDKSNVRTHILLKLEVGHLIPIDL